MTWTPLERIGGQHLVKEPTVLGGTGRYSCDIRNHLSTCESAGQRVARAFPYKEEAGGSSPSAPHEFNRRYAARRGRKEPFRLRMGRERSTIRRSARHGEYLDTVERTWKRAQTTSHVVSSPHRNERWSGCRPTWSTSR